MDQLLRFWNMYLHSSWIPFAVVVGLLCISLILSRFQSLDYSYIQLTALTVSILLMFIAGVSQLRNGHFIAGSLNAIVSGILLFIIVGSVIIFYVAPPGMTSTT